MVALYGVFTGVLTYLIIAFLFQPIMRYRDLKITIISDLIYYYYANIHDIEQKDLEKDNVSREKYWERSWAIRRKAANLEASYFDLPFIYRLWLHLRGEHPIKASFAMIVLSNINDSDTIDFTRDKVEKCLKLKRSFNLDKV